ncbi:MAG TPA: D-sedoheptulose 7-phosphate isomerase [Burkholderiaceae bacterium]|nr:D-sedoheptulose 7-phosphate isomerase [Burkholderiaceae bacterium]HRZ01409.1 D-sedoheptulose 7-phosphate isomerase [Burkholderiaceae bacterium]
MSAEHVVAALAEARDALEHLRADATAHAAIAEAGALLAATFRAGGKVLSCGNGGSMCDAMHFAEELSGRFREDRPGYAAIAMSDPSHLSCVGNDYGYEQVFARYARAVGRAGDVLLAITTSGTSRNVVAAAQAARAAGMKVIALTGRAGTPIVDLADVAIVTPAGRYADRVQELHIKVIHILIELVERELAPGNYAKA